MRFNDVMCILDALATCETGATAGFIQRYMSRAGGYPCDLTKSQVERIMKQLTKDAYLRKEVQQHRPGMMKNVYSINPTAIDALASIIDSYKSVRHQAVLPVSLGE